MRNFSELDQLGGVMRSCSPFRAKPIEAPLKKHLLKYPNIAGRAKSKAGCVFVEGSWVESQLFVIKLDAVNKYKHTKTPVLYMTPRMSVA